MKSLDEFSVRVEFDNETMETTVTVKIAEMGKLKESHEKVFNHD